MLHRMGSFNIALLEALVSVGVPRHRARAVADLFDRSIDERYSLHARILATKTDIAELETRLSRDIAELNARVARDLAETNSRIAETNSRIAETNSRIAETKAELTRWLLAALTAQTALLLGAMKLL
jgi:septal ring factor EnvC (AmiA/AmiB activator)